jgi:protein-tyrosine phosphatase
MTTTSATEIKTETDDGTGDDSTKKFRILIHTLNLINLKLEDAGNYTCYFHNNDKSLNTTSYYIQPIIPPKIVSHNPQTIKTKLFEKNIHLYCVIHAFPLDYFKKSMHWKKEDVDTTFDKDKDFSDLDKINTIIENRTKIIQLNETHVNVTLKINEINKKDNGTYSCAVLSSLLPYNLVEEGLGGDVDEPVDDIKIIKQTTTILVLDIPYVSIDYVQAVGESKIFMNWTLNDGNDPVKLYYIQYMENGTNSYNYYYDRVSGNYTSFVFDKFKPQTSYKFKLAAQNGQGMGTWYEHLAWVKTLEKDPDFIPMVAVKGKFLHFKNGVLNLLNLNVGRLTAFDIKRLSCI